QQITAHSLSRNSGERHYNMTYLIRLSVKYLFSRNTVKYKQVSNHMNVGRPVRIQPSVNIGELLKGRNLVRINIVLKFSPGTQPSSDISKSTQPVCLLSLRDSLPLRCVSGSVLCVVCESHPWRSMLYLGWGVSSLGLASILPAPVWQQEGIARPNAVDQMPALHSGALFLWGICPGRSQSSQGRRPRGDTSFDRVCTVKPDENTRLQERAAPWTAENPTEQRFSVRAKQGGWEGASPEDVATWTCLSVMAFPGPSLSTLCLLMLLEILPIYVTIAGDSLQMYQIGENSFGEMRKMDFHRYVEHTHHTCNISEIILAPKNSILTVTDLGGKNFNAIYLLRFHDISVLTKDYEIQTGEQSYECWKICENSTLSKLESTVAGEKPYACKKGLKTFSRKPTLKRHQKMHTDVKPYIHKECRKL
ncbi:LOW QUALITY PROTEIN: Zinc finger protein 662, partial [Galemys pyrenaicus]